jgi:hypothetical protein
MHVAILTHQCQRLSMTIQITNNKVTIPEILRNHANLWAVVIHLSAAAVSGRAGSKSSVHAQKKLLWILFNQIKLPISRITTIGG